MRKQMEGDNRERRKRAREAREQGLRPSEMGATLGASKQRTEARRDDTQQKRLDLKREGKDPDVNMGTPESHPRSRDLETPDRERHPRRSS